MRYHDVKTGSGMFLSVQRGRARSHRVELQGLISIDQGRDPIVLFDTFSVSLTFISV